jgi:hypothetical protein
MMVTMMTIMILSGNYRDMGNVGYYMGNFW